MKSKRQTAIPERKLKAVKELADLIKNKKTILTASIKNLPASQFQDIKKKLRNKAIIKVPKKKLFFRAIDSIKDGDITKLKEHFKESTALLFSDLDSYDLSAQLIKNKSPAKAKPGQKAPEDIEIEAGPTDLPPGPAISELGAVGLEVQIEKGKIIIKKSKVIVREGQPISQAAVDIMNKLDIKPFSIGFIPLSAYDNETKKLYLEIKIDSEKAIEELKELYGKALAFAVEIGYFNSQTILFLINKAGLHEKALSNIVDSEKEEKSEEKKEETKEEEKKEVQKEETQTPENKSQDEEK